MEQVECHKCRFWNKGVDGDLDADQGTCRRRAPSVVNPWVYDPNTADWTRFCDAETEWRWPITGDDEWCGEAQPREDLNDEQ